MAQPGHPPTAQPPPRSSGLAAAPHVVREYVLAVAREFGAVFGADAIGLYTTGSLALGDFRPGRSDIDLLAVVDPVGAPERRHELARRLDHSRLPCPAAGLEFVLYPRQVVAAPSEAAGYALNLNTGADLPPTASLDPTSLPAFWFVIDRAVAYQSGEAVFGPPARELLVPLGWRQLLPFVAEGNQTQLHEFDDLRDSAVLNACRALRFAADKQWYSKAEAGRRTAAAGGPFAAFVADALEAYAGGRRGGDRLSIDEIRRFLTYVAEVLQQTA
jgi:hypothetical protein